MAGYTNVDEDTWKAFGKVDGPGRIQMLNFIRLREMAEYPNGQEISGAEAYEEYSRLTVPILTGLGGRMVWRGGFELTMIGPSEEIWDICFIIEYPAKNAFLTMVQDPNYHAALVHRQAAAADSRLICLRPPQEVSEGQSSLVQNAEGFHGA
ncbi:MAG: DUF1330 domain-containing protein [Pseudomonadota bacterium]